MAEDASKLLEKTTRALGDITKSLEKSHSHTEKMRFQWAEILKFTEKTKDSFNKWWPFAGRGPGDVFGKIADSLKIAHRATADNIDSVRKKLATMAAERAATESRWWTASRAGNVLEMSRLAKILEGNRATEAGLVSELGLLQSKAALSKAIGSSSTSTAVAILAATKKTWDIYREMNVALIEANADLSQRSVLMGTIWDTQRRLGAGTETMKTATAALVQYGFDLRGDFASMVPFVVQMKEGLGISETHSVQLARVFGVSLKGDVRAVGDAISLIVDQTGLAADEAARFAEEIGRGIQNIAGVGGGGRLGTVKSVESLVAGLKDVGGDPAEVSKLFRAMASGSTQGLMLRGMAGVTVGQMLGGQAWAHGIDRFIRSVVKSRQGTESYVIELEQAAEMLGVSTDTVQKWHLAIEKSNATTDKGQSLQERWKNQVAGVSTGVDRLFNAFKALYQRALLPVMPLFTKFVNTMAWLVEVLGKIPPWLLTVGAAGGAAYGARGLWGVGKGLFGAGGAAQLELPGLAGSAGGLLGRLGLGGIGAGTLATGALAVGAAGAAGVGLGTLFRHAFPDNWIGKLAGAIGEATVKKTQASVAVKGVGTGVYAQWEKIIQEGMVGGDLGSIRAKLIKSAATTEMLKSFGEGRMTGEGFEKVMSNLIGGSITQMQEARFRSQLREGTLPMTASELEAAEALRERTIALRDMARSAPLQIEILKLIAEQLRAQGKVSEAAATESMQWRLFNQPSDEASRNMARSPS